jgi:hypothetical protein
MDSDTYSAPLRALRAAYLPSSLQSPRMKPANNKENRSTDLKICNACPPTFLLPISPTGQINALTPGSNGRALRAAASAR